MYPQTSNYSMARETLINANAQIMHASNSIQSDDRAKIEILKTLKEDIFEKTIHILSCPHEIKNNFSDKKMIELFNLANTKIELCITKIYYLKLLHGNYEPKETEFYLSQISALNFKILTNTDNYYIIKQNLTL